MEEKAATRISGWRTRVISSHRARASGPCGSGYHEKLIVAYSRRKPKREEPTRKRRKRKRRKEAVGGRSEVPTYDSHDLIPS